MRSGISRIGWRKQSAIAPTLHIAYPPLVCGYLFVMRANRAEEVGLVPDRPGAEQGRAVRPLVENDVAIDGHGQPVESVRRFHAALRELADRRGIRDDVSRYEAIALALASTQLERTGKIVDEFPDPGSALRFERFFETLYRQYDERFVYAAPDLLQKGDRSQGMGGCVGGFQRSNADRRGL